jgi:hypothetical protein
MPIKHNTKNYVKIADHKKGRLTSMKLDEQTKANLEDITDILEDRHGLRYSRDLLLRRALDNYCHWIKRTVKQCKQAVERKDKEKAAYLHNRLDREMYTLINLSGRDFAELRFSN